jgi:hypothetical protein
MSTTVTNAAMITIKAGMRILSGIILATNEMTRLDITRTKAVANPIPIPFIAEVVTPNVGHIPSNKENVGFSRNMPLVNTLKWFI